MNPSQRSSAVSIFRPLLLTLLAIALLGYGLIQSVSGYPDPAGLSRLAGALTALWSAIGFLAGLAMVLAALVLLAPSVFLLRRRWLCRQALVDYSNQRPGRRTAHRAVSRQAADEYEFEGHRGDGPRFGPDDPADAYPGYGGQDECEEEYPDGRGDHFGNGRRRACSPGRFDQRRWAETSR